MSLSRRRFLGRLAGTAISIPLASLLIHSTANAADKPHLDPESDQAKALSYTHQSPTGKKCRQCQLYKGRGNAQWGKCRIFSKNLVNADGWCASWSA